MRDSRVFFRNISQEFAPGVIEHIFSIERNQKRIYYLAVRRNLPVSAGCDDPFLPYRDFGAQLWSRTYNKELDIVPVERTEICHAISTPWGTSDMVLKPLNRVSRRFKSWIVVLTHPAGLRCNAHCRS